MNSDKILLFVFPPGGGGAWLVNLIYQLETNLMDCSDEKLIIFDHTVKSQTVERAHAFKYFDSNPDIIYNIDDTKFDKKLFSLTYPFNMYLNSAYKVTMHNMRADTKQFNEQFELLTCNAKANVTDTLFNEYYQTNVDLDSKLIYTDPDKFIDNLFFYLDYHNVVYTKNMEICYNSIRKYRQSCLNPINVIGNMTNIYWLAWCHSLKMIHELPIYCNFLEISSIEEASEALLLIQDQCLQLTKPLCFYWVD